MKINDILIEITKRGSIYDDIMNNLLTPRIDLKPELISEISISFLENKEKIEKVYEMGYFKYYFINFDGFYFYIVLIIEIVSWIFK